METLTARAARPTLSLLFFANALAEAALHGFNRLRPNPILTS
jgi:hypothetical protein